MLSEYEKLSEQIFRLALGKRLTCKEFTIMAKYVERNDEYAGAYLKFMILRHLQKNKFKYPLQLFMLV